MINIKVFVQGNHFFFTFLYAALERLRRQQLYSVRYIYPWNKEFRPSNSDMILSLEIFDGSKCKKRICFDLLDSNEIIYTDALVLNHDFYFKRSYCPQNYTHLPKWLQNKIKPFGLVFACKYNYGLRAFLNLLAVFSPNRSEKISFKSKIGQWYNYYNFPELSAYEYQNSIPKTRFILFQTRAWNPHNHIYWRELNDFRYRIIKALKIHFKGQFIGGFMPDQFSQQHYPDAITPFKTSRGNYIKLIRKASICIYTRGLFNSSAFKLGEYLASGRCIVAEPIINQLPTPLIDGHNYLSFATVDECIAKCEQLLHDQNLIERMMLNNSKYYWEHVEPSQQLARAITMSLVN